MFYQIKSKVLGVKGNTHKDLDGSDLGSDLVGENTSCMSF